MRFSRPDEHDEHGPRDDRSSHEPRCRLHVYEGAEDVVERHDFTEASMKDRSPRA